MTDGIGQFLLGWLLADFLTGAFHWWEDEFGNPDWPLIGKWLIVPNRLHHVSPLAFAENGFWGRNRASLIVAGLIGAAWWALAGLSVFMAATIVGGGIANEVHYLAHRPSASNGVVRVLQQIGLLQSPRGHAMHHRPPFDRNFCVLTDWLNPILEAAGFWRRARGIFA